MKSTGQICLDFRCLQLLQEQSWRVVSTMKYSGNFSAQSSSSKSLSFLLRILFSAVVMEMGFIKGMWDIVARPEHSGECFLLASCAYRTPINTGSRLLHLQGDNIPHAL